MKPGIAILSVVFLLQISHEAIAFSLSTPEINIHPNRQLKLKLKTTKKNGKERFFSPTSITSNPITFSSSSCSSTLNVVSSSSSSLFSSLGFSKKPRFLLLLTLAVSFVSFFLFMSRNLSLSKMLYPKSTPDESFSEPLPLGKIGGCPFIGDLGAITSFNKGIQKIAGKVSSSTPTIFKSFIFGRPTVVVSGSSNIRDVMRKEFLDGKGVRQALDFGNADFVEDIFGSESMSFEVADAKKYQSIRSLVAQSLNEKTVSKGVSALQKVSEEAVDRMLLDKPPTINEITHDMTLDVAWRQIIGLDFKTEEEVSVFRKNVVQWNKALTNFLLYVVPIPKSILRRTKAYKAKEYIVKMIRDKIDEIEKSSTDSSFSNNGDASTLRAMVLAQEEVEGDDKKIVKLTHQQIVDNTLLLILAGSETSSNTLTNAIFLLGKYPEVYKKLVQEQEEIVSKYGKDLTWDILHPDESPYLNAVVKETQRLIPIAGGMARDVEETFTVDGKQVPKDWMVLTSVALTHQGDPKTWENGVDDGSNMDINVGYKPERWLHEDTAPTASEYMPFGNGNRFCVGHILASVEMRAFLAVMARKIKSFDMLTPAVDTKWKEGIISTPKDGVRIVPH